MYPIVAATADRHEILNRTEQFAGSARFVMDVNGAIPIAPFTEPVRLNVAFLQLLVSGILPLPLLAHGFESGAFHTVTAKAVSVCRQHLPSCRE